MAKRNSPMPAWFLDDKERDYWHMAQDIAYRTHLSLVEKDGASWLVSDDGERMVCDRMERLWFETWLALKGEYPEHVRYWVGGRPISNPGA